MPHEDLIAVLGVMIPIVSLVLSLAALMVWIVTAHRRRIHEVDCRHKERLAAIEKGLDIPPEPPPQPQPRPARSRYLLRGLIWLGIGLAAVFGGQDWLRDALGGAGWIGVAVGAAYLIFYFVEGFRASVPRSDAPAPSGDHTL